MQVDNPITRAATPPAEGLDADVPRLRGALDAIRATLSLVGTEYEPDAAELHRQIASIVDAALATVHYHRDTGDLPWPGPVDADCHTGIALVQPE